MLKNKQESTCCVVNIRGLLKFLYVIISLPFFRNFLMRQKQEQQAKVKVLDWMLGIYMLPLSMTFLLVLELFRQCGISELFRQCGMFSCSLYLAFNQLFRGDYAIHSVVH